MRLECTVTCAGKALTKSGSAVVFVAGIMSPMRTRGDPSPSRIRSQLVLPKALGLAESYSQTTVLNNLCPVGPQIRESHSHVDMDGARRDPTHMCVATESESNRSSLVCIF